MFYGKYGISTRAYLLCSKVQRKKYRGVGLWACIYTVTSAKSGTLQQKIQLFWSLFFTCRESQWKTAFREDLMLSKLKSVDWKRFCCVRQAVKCLRGTWVCSPQPAVLSPMRDKLSLSSCWERANAEKLCTRVTPPPGPPLLPPLAGLSPPRFHLEATKVR